MYNKMTKIYLVENCFGDSNKVYIGKTISSRKKEHVKTYGEKIIYTFIDEIDSFDKKLWKPLETYWIEQFRQWGFEVVNKNAGGGGVEFMSFESKLKMKKPKPNGFGDTTSKRLLGTKQTPETIEKRRVQLIGKKRTPEQKQTLRESFKGRIFSEERNKKIGDAQRGIPQPKSPELIAKLKKPICQYDKQGNFIQEWESATDAALKYGSTTTIQNALKERRCKTAYGFIWKYKN
jgi:hypothetical protein